MTQLDRLLFALPLGPTRPTKTYFALNLKVFIYSCQLWGGLRKRTGESLFKPSKGHRSVFCGPCARRDEMPPLQTSPHISSPNLPRTATLRTSAVSLHKLAAGQRHGHRHRRRSHRGTPRWRRLRDRRGQPRRGAPYLRLVEVSQAGGPRC